MIRKDIYRKINKNDYNKDEENCKNKINTLDAH